MDITPRTMRESVRNTTFMDILRLLMFFSVYFGQAEPFTSYNYDYERYETSIPKFMKVPHNITVRQGELAKLKCHIDNLGPKMVTWRKFEDEFPLTVGDKTFTPDKRVEVEIQQITVNESRWDLIIQEVDQSHAGLYQCQISATKTYTQNVTLNVLDPIVYKQEIKIKAKPEYVSLREEITLVCNATGSVSAFESVDWFFDGEPMIKSRPPWAGRVLELKRVPIPGRSLIAELIISRATMADQGHYVCRATSKLADGIKVHVLNDTRTQTPKIRDARDPNEPFATPSSYNSSDAMELKHTYVIVVMSLCCMTYCMFSW